ncbi:MAG: DUF4360 domain-containing protein [Methylotenera sp.]|nr:DUF4360 domain-containing protein [Oligoflexia bacterium]
MKTQSMGLFVYSVKKSASGSLQTLAWSLSLTVTLGLSANTVFAQGDRAPLIKPYHVMTAGSGCSAGKVTVEANSTGATVRMKLKTSDAEVGADAGTNLARKACTVAISAQVPVGYQLGMMSPALRVSHQLGESSTALYAAEYFVAGEESPVNTRRFTALQSAEDAGTGTEVLTLSLSKSTIWSECSLANDKPLTSDRPIESGTGAIFRINTSVVLKTDSAEASSASLRGFESDEIQFVLRSCQ